MMANSIKLSTTAFVAPEMFHNSAWFTVNKITGNMMMKYNSSRNDVAITMAELFPTPMPSLCTKRIAMLVPPMADGVTADVNSQRKIIRSQLKKAAISP